MTLQERLANLKTVYVEMVIGAEKLTKELIKDILIKKNLRIKGARQNIQFRMRLVSIF